MSLQIRVMYACHLIYDDPYNGYYWMKCKCNDKCSAYGFQFHIYNSRTYCENLYIPYVRVYMCVCVCIAGKSTNKQMKRNAKQKCEAKKTWKIKTVAANENYYLLSVTFYLI